MPVYVALENVRSLLNVGAIFRTCSFFGIENVILLGYTAKERRTVEKTIGTADGRALHTALHTKVSKTALGAEKDLNIVFMQNAKELAEFAPNPHGGQIVRQKQKDWQKQKLPIICIEQHKNAKNLKNYDFGKFVKNGKKSARAALEALNCILVFGNEIEGISAEVLEICDDVVEIERLGKHNSLNVATSVGIVLHRMLS